MSWLVLKELQRKCCLFLKAISSVILELFLWFPDGFCHLCKATKNSPPPKSVLPEFCPAHPDKALCQSNSNPHFWTFPGIWSHLSSKINHPDDVTSAAGEIPLSPTWQHRWEASAGGGRGFFKPLAAESQTLEILVCKLSLIYCEVVSMSWFALAEVPSCLLQEVWRGCTRRMKILAPCRWQQHRMAEDKNWL